MSDAFRIPVLVGGELDGRPAPPEWLEGTDEGMYLYPDRSALPEIGPPQTVSDVHTYVPVRLRLGARPEERGRAVIGLVAQRHTAHAPRLFADKLVELAERSLAPPVSAENRERIWGYDAHLVLRDERGATIDVPGWLREPRHLPVALGVVNVDAVAAAVDEARRDGRLR